MFYVQQGEFKYMLRRAGTMSFVVYPAVYLFLKLWSVKPSNNEQKVPPRTNPIYKFWGEIWWKNGPHFLCSNRIKWDTTCENNQITQNKKGPSKDCCCSFSTFRTSPEVFQILLFFKDRICFWSRKIQNTVLWSTATTTAPPPVYPAATVEHLYIVTQTFSLFFASNGEQRWSGKA